MDRYRQERGTAAMPAAVRVIFNADDYGYFPSVSRGILDAARHGVVNAAGILATSPYFAEHVPWLASCPEVDLGVHLNLTAGRPLTAAMQAALGRWGGEFPGKYAMALAVASGRVPLGPVEGEWRAQIQRCIDAGLHLYFLNSHEHLHVLPSLARLTRRLAQEFGIPFVRRPVPEWRGGVTAGGVVRNTILFACDRANGSAGRPSTPGLLGIGQSGRIDLPYLRRIFAVLRPGEVYELMCHPGYHPAGEVADPRLLAYHRWEQELTALSGEPIRHLLGELHVEPIRYRDISDQTSASGAAEAQHQEVAHG
jgi:predicted glycoside hydrolase/deacetylase ChbG (UPF0249 family)